MAETLLALRDIKVDYGDLTALEISSLDVHAGEVLAVIGPNGAGKSTLLRVMGLLQVPTSGKVFFRDQESARNNSLNLRRRMASVFQEPLLLNASVYDNAALGLKLRGLNPGDIEQELRPWLERLEISDLAIRRVRTLSGGEAQRTNLARALVLNPELLLFDEPFSALDQPTRDGLLDDLQRILKQTGITTVFVTHDRDEAFRLASRVAILIGGRMLQLGPSLEVFTKPHSETVAEVVGFENRISGVVESVARGMATIHFNGGIVTALGGMQPGERVVMCMRAESIGLHRSDRETCSSGELNHFKGKITSVSPGMLRCGVTLKNGETTLKSVISREELRDLELREGVEVIVTFQPNAVHLVRELQK